MSDISLEDLEDLENIKLSESPTHKLRPYIVPSLSLTQNPELLLRTETKPVLLKKDSIHQLSSVQEVLLRKKARGLIESKQVQNFENFEKNDFKLNYSVEELLIKAESNWKKPQNTKFFNAKRWLNAHSNTKVNLKKHLKGISESIIKLDEASEESFKIKDIEIAMNKSLTDFIKMIQKKNLNANTVLKDGWNLVLLAAKNDKSEVFEYLITREQGRKGEKLELAQGLFQFTASGMNILHICAYFSSVDILKTVVKAMKNLEGLVKDSSQTSFSLCLESTTKKKITPFLAAVHEDKVEQVKFFAEIGCNIWAKNEKLENSLHIAYKNKSIEMIKLLSYLDADKNTLKTQLDLHKHKPSDLDPSKKLIKYQRHPWELVHQGKLESFIKFIHHSNQSLNSSTFKKKNTFLHIAIKHHQTSIVSYLLKNGAQKDLKNYKNLTPLQMASIKGDNIYYSLIQSLFSSNPQTKPQPLSSSPLSKLPKNPIKASRRTQSIKIILPAIKPSIENLSKHFF